MSSCSRRASSAGRRRAGTAAAAPTPTARSFVEEQRLWPQMDELLGYPTEFRPCRMRIALDRSADGALGQLGRNAARAGLQAERLDPARSASWCRSSATTSSAAPSTNFGGHANPQRTVQAYAWALAGPRRPHPASTRRSRGSRAAAAASRPSRPRRARSAATRSCSRPGPQTGRLAAKLGVGVPLAPARAEMIVHRALAADGGGGVDGNGLYGRQTLRGNLVYGGGPHEWLDEAALWARRGARQHAAAPEPRPAAGRAVPRRRAHAGHPELGGHHREHAGRAARDRRLAEPDNVVVATMSSVGFGLSPASRPGDQPSSCCTARAASPTSRASGWRGSATRPRLAGAARLAAARPCRREGDGRRARRRRGPRSGARGPGRARPRGRGAARAAACSAPSTGSGSSCGRARRWASSARAAAARP